MSSALHISKGFLSGHILLALFFVEILFEAQILKHLQTSWFTKDDRKHERKPIIPCHSSEPLRASSSPSSDKIYMKKPLICQL